MTRNAERIYSEAMSLDPDQRTELAERLLESVEPSTDPGYLAAWEEELRRRIDDLESGRVKAIPWEEARRTMFGAGGRDANPD